MLKGRHGKGGFPHAMAPEFLVCVAYVINCAFGASRRLICWPRTGSPTARKHRCAGVA